MNHIMIVVLLVLCGCSKAQQTKVGSSSMAIVSKEIILEKAEEVFVETYGERVLKQRPFVAVESEKYWTVEGTFHCPEGSVCKGGVAEAVFDKFSGDLKSVIHGK